MPIAVYFNLNMNGNNQLIQIVTRNSVRLFRLDITSYLYLQFELVLKCIPQLILSQLLHTKSVFYLLKFVVCKLNMKHKPAYVSLQHQQKIKKLLFNTVRLYIEAKEFTSIQLMSQLYCNQQQTTLGCSTNNYTNLLAQDINLDLPNIDSKNVQVVNRSNKLTNVPSIYSINVNSPPNMHRSLNMSNKQLPLIQANSSIFTNGLETVKGINGPFQVFPLQMQDVFKCSLCNSKDKQFCFACQGNKTITKDNPLIKFLSYVIEFKLGKQNSYLTKLQNSPVSIRPISDKMQALRMTQPSRMSLSEIKNECENIHYGYFCNGCNNDEPIRGSRFNCPVCQDYDLCSNCYNLSGHKHAVNEIAKSPSYKHKIQCFQMISQRKYPTSHKNIKDISSKIYKLQEKIFSSSIR